MVDDDSQDSWRRRIFDSILPDKVKKAVSQAAETLAEEHVSDKVILEAIKKAVSKGSEVVDSTEDSVRKWLGDLPIPKELIDRISARIDDLKGDVVSLLKDETHHFFERIDIGRELQRVLTSLSLQLTMELKFVPNDRTIVAPKLERKSTRIKKTAESKPEPEQTEEKPEEK